MLKWCVSVCYIKCYDLASRWIFGRRVLENTPIPLFEQILNSSPMGVFSRDYGIMGVVLVA